MNYLSVEQISKSYDEKPLLNDLTFGLEQGQKAALVGVNGCGKSTLLRIISGQETPDTGRVSFRNDLNVSMLHQHPEFNDDETILEAVFSNDLPEFDIIRDYQTGVFKASLDPEHAPDLTPLIEKMDAVNAWEYEHQMKELLGKLDIHRTDQKMGELSGGQKKRVAIAQALVVKPDVLILDEPTNHLDLTAIEWLEHYLSTQNLTLLMVTHDRYFLDRVTNEILEIDRGTIFRHKGNYRAFLEQKQERNTMELRAVDKARNLMKKELEWMRKQPKARGTKAKYRVDAFNELKEQAKSDRQTQAMEVNLRGERQGKKILEMHHVTKSFGEQKPLDDFSYVFRKKERVGIVGPNGVGKSTFLNILSQQSIPDSGQLATGQTTRFGYYKQDESIFDPNMKVLDVVKEVAEYIRISDGSEVTASRLLDRFLFPPNVQHGFVGKLSGGEKRRLQLLRVLMSNPNFLLLDEPTNDLDIVTLNVLEDYLDSFDGCLIIVSHDRYFMDRLVDHLFVFKGNGLIKDFPGNYSDYRNTLEADTRQEASKEKEKPKKTTPERASEKLTYNEQRELDSIDKELPKLSQRKEELETEMNRETAYEKLQALSDELKQINEEIDTKEMRWLTLSERA